MFTWIFVPDHYHIISYLPVPGPMSMSHIWDRLQREKQPKKFPFCVGFGFGERKSSRRTSREKNTKKVRSDPIKNLIRQILCAMRDACWPSQSKFEGDLLLTIVAAVDKRSDSLRS